MIRILNEDKGNSGNSTLSIGMICDHANESYENLSKTFFSEMHPVMFTLQSLLHNVFILMCVSLKGENGNSLLGCAIFHCLVASNFRSFPDHSTIQIKNTASDQFLKSSEKCPMLETMEDLSKICLVRHEKTKCIIAAVFLHGTTSESAIAWVSLGIEASDAPDTEVTRIYWKQFRGWESSDGKMCSILAGHQGASSKFPCLGCTKSQEQIKQSNCECIARIGEYSNENCFQKYLENDVCTTKKEMDVQRDRCLNITMKPLFDVPLDKKIFGPSHTTTGNYGHLDTLLLEELEDIESRSSFRSQMQEMKDFLADLLKDVKNEIKTRKIKLKKDRKKIG
jgi:hypothetical protein